MWRNYLTVGARALAKNRTYAFINIFGLALGLAACLLILLYVRYETSYDRWIPGADTIYQVQSFSRDPDTGDRFDFRQSQYVAGTTLQKDFPQIAGRLHLLGNRAAVVRGGQALSVEDAARVDGPFFDVFPLPLIEGDPATALARPGNVVLSEREALRLFGTEPAFGRTLTVVDNGRPVDYRVTGILKTLPRNSHLRLDMILRIDVAAFFADYPGQLTSWGEISGFNYVKLRPGADVDAIRAGLPAWEKRNIPDQPFGDRRENDGENQDWRLIPLRDIHLGEAQRGAMEPANDRSTILTFAVVALLILGMACINFTNLATARAGQRAREVALRKVLGASRRQLVIQFLSESILIAGLAMLVALTMVELALPILSTFLDADLEMHYLGSGGVMLPVLLLVIVVGAAGGLYPAFYLSRFQPAQVLKANKSAAEAEGSGRLRNVLVVAQFAVSIGLIICTAIVYSQAVHARRSDPGFERDGLLQISAGYRNLVPVLEAMTHEIGRIDGVVSASRTSIGINTGSTMGRAVRVPGRSETVGVGNYAVDPNFFQTMGIKLLAGRALDPKRPMDESGMPYPEPDPAAERALVARGANVVVNALAARRLGFSDPASAVGKQVRVTLSLDPSIGMVPVTIVGVVADSRFRSIRQPLEPMMYRLGSDYLLAIDVRYQHGRGREVRSAIEQVWRRFAPDLPFEARYSEDIVSGLYLAERARAQTFAGFAALAVVVACLGLFGLAAFTAERRRKEIGIRKVLGARTRDIVRLLAWQFSKPVIVANLIAWPAAWWAMRDWLNRFDARIELGAGPFLFAGALALAIAIGTIASHAFRVARSNPIHALRYE
ncbi:ABC transporter permease [Sphingosinicella sp. BN140058]|uniref:ABC transporter permease n=1 Tax=Sphingosinicella sp. BN140058 TaxID=1892855 RepID=UPI00101128BC|nr:ABC transporter permease [Sphingosinicella sp. BN140058]QAY76821.1 FtsX-like permease family protein [Sphingosinicella sp. BN140058]